MIPRHIAPALISAAATSPVVTLTGPRQSGKTTLLRATFPDHRYQSLEAPDTRAWARSDPRGFLAQADRMVLDEVQRVPDLLSYIQVLVDDDPAPGRFALSGSLNLLLLESVSQTLAGRTARLTLHPLSMAELRGQEPLDPETLDRAGRRPTTPPTAKPSELWETLVRGFYPAIHARGAPAPEWYEDYFATYVERDLREALRVSDPAAFETFVRLAAGRAATELNLSALANDAAVSQQTARRWLTALEIGYLATTLRPHHRNFAKRLRRRPRLHFLDSGLVCSLLGIRDAATLETHPLRGAVFESFVVAELVKAFAARRRRPPLFFWRDSRGREIDVLIELAGRLVPVEVKSGLTVRPSALRTLEWWTAIPSNPTTGGVLVHGGAEDFMMKGFRIAPWFLSRAHSGRH